MTQCSNICGAYPVNNQILLFDGHDSHFDNIYLIKTQSKNINPFMLKSGDSINDHPNDKRPNSKLKAIYNILKDKQMLKYGTTRFQPHHMNYVLVETRKDFTVLYHNSIRDSFDKTRLLSLSPPNTIINTQTCVASIQNIQKASVTFQKTQLHLLICLRQVPTILW